MSNVFVPRPLGVERVLERALCLDILQARLSLERDPADTAPEKANGLGDFLKRTGLHKALSSSERRLMGLAIGSWEQRDLVDGSWRRESLGVLLWALGKISELPPWDEEIRTDEWYSGQDLFELRARNQASLRSEEVIAEARDCAEIWHWRARTTLLMRGEVGPIPEGLEMDTVLFMSSDLSWKRGWCGEPIDGDYPAFGKAYRDLDDQEYMTVSSLALERHYALNWLCGYASNWDKVPTNT